MNKGVFWKKKLYMRIIMNMHPRYSYIGLWLDRDPNMMYSRLHISSTKSKLNQYFSNIGQNYGIGLLGGITGFFILIMAIWKVIKFIIDSLVHGTILYEIYGASWYLLTALWDSLTSYLSHRRDANNGKGREKEKKGEWDEQTAIKKNVRHSGDRDGVIHDPNIIYLPSLVSNQ